MGVVHVDLVALAGMRVNLTTKLWISKKTERRKGKVVEKVIWKAGMEVEMSV